MITALLLAATVGYLAAVVVAARRGRSWPLWRTAAWCAGVLVALAAPHGADRHDFVAHMIGHLMLGMLAPLLLVLSAPVTLALRALPVGPARGLSRLLATRVVRFVTHPVVAATLDAGGLWLLYTTTLHHTAPQPLVDLHVLAAGYLFTAAIVGVDPAPHRPGRPFRAAVLIAFLAAHGILAKHLYANPPVGVPEDAARAGAMLMYYGGDLAHLALIVLFCHQWHRATGSPKPRVPWRLPAEFRA